MTGEMTECGVLPSKIKKKAYRQALATKRWLRSKVLTRSFLARAKSIR